MKTLVNEPSLSDVSFTLDDGEIIHAHRAILVARSPYFRGLLDGAGLLDQATTKKVSHPHEFQSLNNSIIVPFMIPRIEHILMF